MNSNETKSNETISKEAREVAKTIQGGLDTFMTLTELNWVEQIIQSALTTQQQKHDAEIKNIHVENMKLCGKHGCKSYKELEQFLVEKDITATTFMNQVKKLHLEIEKYEEVVRLLHETNVQIRTFIASQTYVHRTPPSNVFKDILEVNCEALNNLKLKGEG